MDDSQLLRYSRHILLDELGPDAQQKFAAAEVVLVGMGGLGTPAAQFLAAAGVGTLTLCDADHVDLTNLQRQVLYAMPDVGKAKVDAAAAASAFSMAALLVSRCRSRLASRMRFGDSRPSSTLMSGSMPLAWIERPAGV